MALPELERILGISARWLLLFFARPRAHSARALSLSLTASLFLRRTEDRFDEIDCPSSRARIPYALSSFWRGGIMCWGFECMGGMRGCVLSIRLKAFPVDEERARLVIELLVCIVVWFLHCCSRQ